MKTYVYNYKALPTGKVLVNAIRHSKNDGKYSVVPMTYSLTNEEWNKVVKDFKRLPFVIDISLVKGKGATLNA